jgi:hypothetical protein
VAIARCLPAAGITHYGFVDPSGGSEDAMTLAIAELGEIFSRRASAVLLQRTIDDAHRTTMPDKRTPTRTSRF